MRTDSKRERWLTVLLRHGPLSIAGALLLAAVAVNFANVIARYGFHSAIFWAEEAMVYLSIWAIFLAAIAIAYDRSELTMDFFSNRFPGIWRQVAYGVTTVASALACLFMAWQALAAARVLIRNDQRSLALELPIVIPQASMFVGFVLIALALAVRRGPTTRATIPPPSVAEDNTASES